MPKKKLDPYNKPSAERAGLLKGNPLEPHTKSMSDRRMQMTTFIDREAYVLLNECVKQSGRSAGGILSYLVRAYYKDLCKGVLSEETKAVLEQLKKSFKIDIA